MFLPNFNSTSACYCKANYAICVPPNYSVSSIVGCLKGKSTTIVFEKYCLLKKIFWGTVFGHVGIILVLLAQDEAKARKYVQDQEINETAEDDTEVIPFRDARVIGYNKQIIENMIGHRAFFICLRFKVLVALKGCW